MKFHTNLQRRGGPPACYQVQVVVREGRICSLGEGWLVTWKQPEEFLCSDRDVFSWRCVVCMWVETVLSRWEMLAEEPLGGRIGLLRVMVRFQAQL